jgi:hypothetical protein
MFDNEYFLAGFEAGLEKLGGIGTAAAIGLGTLGTGVGLYNLYRGAKSKEDRDKIKRVASKHLHNLYGRTNVLGGRQKVLGRGLAKNYAMDAVANRYFHRAMRAKQNS